MTTENTYVIRPHPGGGYVSIKVLPGVNAEGQPHSRLPREDDESFRSVARALAETFQRHERCIVDIDPLCEVAEQNALAEAADLVRIVNTAREWFDRRSAKLTIDDQIKLGGALFPERVAEAFGGHGMLQSAEPVKELLTFMGAARITPYD